MFRFAPYPVLYVAGLRDFVKFNRAPSRNNRAGTRLGTSWSGTAGGRLATSWGRADFTREGVAGAGLAPGWQLAGDWLDRDISQP